MNPAGDGSRIENTLAAWGSGVRIGDRLGGGSRNEVWLVAIDGTPYAARRSARPPAALEWELDLLQYLHERGVRVPSIRPTHDGRRHVDGLSLFEWLDGDPPTSESDWRAVEHTLRRVHLLARSWLQRPSFRSTVELLHHERGGDVRLDLMPAPVVQQCRAAWRCLIEEPMSVIHGDPGASNIRMSPSGVGIFDWDEARVDAAVLDLAALPVSQFDGCPTDRLAQIRTALDAWEVANGWMVEPSYARRRLGPMTSSKRGIRFDIR